MKFSFKTKLTFYTVAIIFIFGTLATYGVFIYSKDKFIENEKNNLQLLTGEYSREFTQVFRQGRILAESIALDPSIKEYFLISKELQEPHVLDHLKILNIEDAYSAIYLMDKSGQTLVSTDPSFVGKNYSFRGYFINAISDRPDVSIAVGVTSKELGYYFSHPIKDDNGNIVGVVVAKMKPSFLHEIIEFSDLIADSTIMMTDHLGVVIFSNREDRIYKSLGPLLKENLLEIKQNRVYEGIEIGSLGYDNVKQRIDLKEKRGVLSFYDLGDQKEEVLAFSQVDGLPFYLVIERDSVLINNISSQISFFISILVFFAAFFAASVIFIVLSRLLDPLSKLKKGVEKINKGDLTYRVDINTGDEFEDLANDFNTMAENLLKVRSNIEKKVRDRTRELNILTKYMTGREIKMIKLKKELKEKNKKEG